MSWYKLHLSWVEMSYGVWPWGLTRRVQFASQWWHFHTDLGIAQKKMFFPIRWHSPLLEWGTPGQSDQQKMDAAVTEIFRSASEMATLEEQKDAGLKSSPRCKRKVCIVAFSLWFRLSTLSLPKRGWRRWFLFSLHLVLSSLRCSNVCMENTWQMFSAMLRSLDFNQPENMASLHFLNLLLVNALWNDFTAL